ncbi:restriction endonuclease subunit S [Hoylesella shahii]|uniref:Type I restriction enzyme S subunit n=1 Tax=Hoylesella shahii DSM 15611 = JCM 12083 TaxID=1122991 RepID=A0A318HQN0_9BACT|nr:restriction endonuclease subunit S [Hoylesella shahii]PXX20099.1 type I restriction enzyme S subunit [Hoylesella shahii DSM 15611 = JCM 12083]
MKYIEKLLNGAEVKWMPLGEVAEIYGGLTGKSKADFEDGNALFVSYKNIYDNYEIDVHNLARVKVSDDERQNKIEYGDILFTGSSETAEDVAFSSAVTSVLKEPVYLNSFSFGIRFNKEVEMMPEFCKHLFRGSVMRKQLKLTASGVTRFNVSKARFKRVLVPIPPLRLQEEIVRILDKFTTLEAELDCRKRQYEYYRNQLLSLDVLIREQGLDKVEYKALSEVAEIRRGKRLVKSELSTSGNYAVYQNSMIPLGYYSKSNVSEGTTFVISAGSAGEIGYSPNRFWAADDVYYFIFTDGVCSKYVYYFLLIKQQSIKRQVRRASVPRLSKSAFEKIKIPIPSLAEQQRIVSILDKFEALTTSISEGLPKEIELRRKQYEYYRNQLLSFA